MLHAPVILVIDVVGITRGIAPLLVGYRAFGPDVHVTGVIFNKVGSTRQEEKITCFSGTLYRYGGGWLRAA